METISLFSLFISSFVAASLVPIGSELTFIAVIVNETAAPYAALFLATLGNTLGGFTTYVLGRVLPQRKMPSRRIIKALKKWGSPALVFSWLPLVGDALCLAAGWLRQPWFICIIFMGMGKFFRYWIILLGIA